MKIVITGATGFIGTNLASGLHEDGMKVMATGRSVNAGRELQERGIEFKAADLLDRDRLVSLSADAECVIHCAANADLWGKYRDFHDANVIGTRHVIHACRKQGITRIIFISTPSVYFNGRDRIGITEDEPLPAKQHSFYAQTKLIAEEELRACDAEGIETIILRPRAVFGPHDNTILPHILRLSGLKRFPLINGGRALIDITSVANLVDAVRLCLDAPAHAWNRTYNITNGDPVRLKDWFASILEALDRPFRPRHVPAPVAMLAARLREVGARFSRPGRKPALTRFAVGYMARSMTLSIDKAKAVLGYRPRVGNQAGLESYVAWYRSKRGDEV